MGGSFYHAFYCQLVLSYQHVIKIILYHFYCYVGIGCTNSIVHVAQPNDGVPMLKVRRLILKWWLLTLTFSRHANNLTWFIFFIRITLQNKLRVNLLPLFVSAIETWIVCLKMTVDEEHSNLAHLKAYADRSLIR